MKYYRFFAVLTCTWLVALSIVAQAQEQPTVRVGVASVLSGDFANLGQNIVRTVETYKKYKLRHPIVFEFEDAKLSSADGLKAYQSLINLKKVDLLIGATSSNGTMAASGLINSSKTVLITPVTGGSQIDRAGEFIFRIGNSDILNGVDQAAYFHSQKLTRVALLSEQTEYTLDIATSFRDKFKELGGALTFDDTFTPGTTDFKSLLPRLLSSSPEALFVPTQTGVALALILKQIQELGGYKGEVHTTFVAAPNPDARKIAGDLLKNVHFLNPVYDHTSPALADFVALFKKEYGVEPAIPFHTAGTVDALNMLQDYLDENKGYDREKFKTHLLTRIKRYKGLMGTYSFDAQGNSDLGFEPAQVY